VTVLHGGADKVCDVLHARHTAELVQHAQLDIYDDLGHFSIVSKVVPTITALLTR
jgi:pimeloyl-ACP methyl ester carboxylesterase